MTARELIEILETYPPETPLFTPRGGELRASHITETMYDDWEHGVRTPEGEIPARGVGLAIGPRF